MKKLKQYTDSGVNTFLEINPSLRNNAEWYESIWLRDELRYLIDLTLKFPKDISEYLSDNRIDPFHHKINKFLDKVLPEGKICSIAAGTGIREFWLCNNSNKTRTFYISDLFYNKYLNECSEIFDRNCKKGNLNIIDKPINVTYLPYEDACFNAVFAGSVIYALNDTELRQMLKNIERILMPDGIAVIWCYSIITPVSKIKFLTKKILGKELNKRPKGWKHCGYLRTRKELEKTIKEIPGLKITKFFKIERKPFLGKNLSNYFLVNKLLTGIHFRCGGYILRKH